MTVKAMPEKIQTPQDGIQDVWHSNLEEEFKKIRKIVQKYPYVAMDTEFPGVVARPIGEFRSQADYQYQMLRCNVDLLKVIQLSCGDSCLPTDESRNTVGLTFFNEDGQTATPVSTWQFNFKFSLSDDMFAQDSIDLLQKCGINFNNNDTDGIDVIEFAEVLMTSGVVLMDNVNWLSFHSGYDFGYMLKILTNKNLPEEEQEFFELLKLYFPNIYDVKYLMKSCKTLKGGLQEVADQLEIQRIGPQHQAGSDSLLTGAAFFKMREMFFEDNIDDAKYCGHLYGLGTSYIPNGSSYENHHGYGPPQNAVNNTSGGSGVNNTSNTSTGGSNTTNSTSTNSSTTSSNTSSATTGSTNNNSNNNGNNSESSGTGTSNTPTNSVAVTTTSS